MGTLSWDIKSNYGLASEFENRKFNRDKSGFIKWVQASLNKIQNARLTVDGIPGVRTRAAVMLFQRNHGLKQDGVANPQTVSVIKSILLGKSKQSVLTPIPEASHKPSARYKVLMPPVEGPWRGIKGWRCPSGKGKCWGEGQARDIIDDDVPWNNEKNRSPENYAALIDYFNVDHPHNRRYQHVDGKYYCNIFAHDVTRGMWASIPHWVRDPLNAGRWKELGANATHDWMHANSASIGWVQIKPELCRWIESMNRQRRILPSVQPVIPEMILKASTQIAAKPHEELSLLLQPSYIAQQYANLGLPVVISLKNANGAGHMAVVRPEQGKLKGIIHGTPSIFLPRTAQAGSRNWNNQPAGWILSSINNPNHKFCFFVHT
jgi:hypothetical protein